MTEGIMIAIITGGLAVLGNMIVVVFNNSKTLYRIEQLEKKVDKHNGFGEKIPVIQEQIKVINHRLEDLEAHS